MKLTITNWDARPASFAAQAAALRAHVAETGSGLVLLPEMPFTPWLPLSEKKVQADWEQSVHEHDARIAELGTMLGVALAGSRPLVEDGVNRNQAFLWADGLWLPVLHQKCRLPAEDWYWEAHWFEPGTPQTTPLAFGGLKFGFAICTELWDSNHGRKLARAGADVLLVPRATPDFGNDVWVAGARALAVQTGCYVLSANFAYARTADFIFEGLAAACGPDGELMALTSAATPFATVEISAEASRRAKTTYPRYIYAGERDEGRNHSM